MKYIFYLIILLCMESCMFTGKNHYIESIDKSIRVKRIDGNIDRIYLNRGKEFSDSNYIDIPRMRSDLEYIVLYFPLHVTDTVYVEDENSLVRGYRSRDFHFVVSRPDKIDPLTGNRTADSGWSDSTFMEIPCVSVYIYNWLDVSVFIDPYVADGESYYSDYVDMSFASEKISEDKYRIYFDRHKGYSKTNYIELSSNKKYVDIYIPCDRYNFILVEDLQGGIINQEVKDFHIAVSKQLPIGSDIYSDYIMKEMPTSKMSKSKGIKTPCIRIHITRDDNGIYICRQEYVKFS